MIMFCTLRAWLINMRHCHFCLHIDQLAGCQSPLIFAYFQLDNWSRNSGVFILGARCPLYSCQHSRAFYWQLINWPRGYTRNTRESLQLFPHFPGLVSSGSVCSSSHTPGGLCPRAAADQSYVFIPRPSGGRSGHEEWHCTLRCAVTHILCHGSS